MHNYLIRFVRMRKAIFILMLGLIFSSCKKSTTAPISANDGTYVGEVSIEPMPNYITQETFEVKALSYSKIKILFQSSRLAAEADLNGSNFKIIPAKYRLNDGQNESQCVISGEGSFAKNTITIRWRMDNLSVKNSYSEYRGTLTKF